MALGIAGAPAGAFAEPLALSVAWGNDAGCRLVGGDNTAGEDRFVLRAESIEIYETGCDIVEAMPARDGAAVVTGLCQNLDSQWVAHVIVTKPDAEKGTRQVLNANGELWAEVHPCT
jgi:hypothetical protein